jgi:hypothetical protein
MTPSRVMWWTTSTRISTSFREHQVAQVVGALGRPGQLSVRGMSCMANSNPGLPGRGLVRPGEVDVGVPDEVGRAIGRRGLLGEVDIGCAVSALCSAFDMREFVPQTISATRPRLGEAQRRVAGRRAVAALEPRTPLLRWVFRPRVLLTLACAALVLHVARDLQVG